MNWGALVTDTQHQLKNSKEYISEYISLIPQLKNSRGDLMEKSLYPADFCVRDSGRCGIDQIYFISFICVKVS